MIKDHHFTGSYVFKFVIFNEILISKEKMDNGR